MQTLKFTKKYETYPDYKNSGVVWLSNIPKEWKVYRAKNLFKKMERTPKDGDEIVTAFRDGVVTLRKNRREDGFTMADKEIGYQRIEKGDLVIHGMDAFAGAIGVSDSDGKSSPVYSACVPIRGSDPKYHSYLLRHMSKSNYIFALAKGIRERSTEFRFKEFSTLEVAEPSRVEQVKIAKYLDEKLFLLDQIIEKKEKQIELLKEKRMIFINQAINNVKGTEEKLKYIASEENIKSELLSSHITYIGMENIESNTGKYIPSLENISPESVSKVFYKNNVLFGKLRPYLAKVYSSEFSGICSGEFLVLKPRKEKMISKFLFYKLISKDFITKVNDSTYGSQMPRASWQFIGNQTLVYPTLVEQKEIVEKLDTKTSLYEGAINKVTASIEKLKEFRTSLISNVVTGKIKV